METIYVQLLNEGTICFRPVPATKVFGSKYKVGGEDFYDPKDETWEFLPGSIVTVEKKNLSGDECLVAITNAE
jgi:hypothetical protein